MDLYCARLAAVTLVLFVTNILGFSRSWVCASSVERSVEFKTRRGCIDNIIGLILSSLEKEQIIDAW